MRILIDTHVFLWWLAGDRRLSRRVRTLLSKPSVIGLVSAASAWEIATKTRLGKLPGVELVAGDVPGAIASQGFEELPIRVLHAQRAGMLAGEDRDPFDRILAAQAEIEAVPLASDDKALDSFGICRLW